ncbi:MAG: GNAT family N-acetyltransferase [Anaerolineales bacterium]|nr:GNAT family N-acetyltransferase [Anaerolineales bacterium]
MLKLIPMTQDIYDAYIENQLMDYAQEHVKTGNWKPEEALERAREQVSQLLPDGLQSENQYLYSLHDDEAGENVGMLWFAVREQGNTPEAFIYDIVIDETYRRQGYASSALEVMEAKVLELGIHKISLHVFGHNSPAISLYEKIGFQPTNIMMSKELDD